MSKYGSLVNSSERADTECSPHRAPEHDSFIA